MDSYDELASNIIESNLYHLNKLSNWTSKEYSYFPKVIFTTRTEIIKDGYKLWFAPAPAKEEIINLKEIKIESFNEK